MSFVLYGSFNRPYSFLASLRADRLAAAGGRLVEWRPVVRDPAVQVNTTATIAGYPALHGPQANRQHAALFEAFWADGLDIGNRAVPAGSAVPLSRPAIRCAADSRNRRVRTGG